MPSMMRRLTSGPKPAPRVLAIIWIESSPGTRSPYRTPSYRARFDDASDGAIR